MYSAKRLVTVALLGQPPGYFLLALPARSQVILMLEAWGESENSGDSNTRAMSGEWIFQRQAQSPRSAGGGGKRGVRDGSRGYLALLQELLPAGNPGRTSTSGGARSQLLEGIAAVFSLWVTETLVQ